jgi:hypothetical protein
VLLSDTERELLFERLNHHAAAGTFDLQELERRVAVVASAETRDQAWAAVSDLPALPGEKAQNPSRRRPRWGRGHAESDQPRPDWRPTAERFRDPRTNQVMRVWEDAAGNRHYVPET